MRITGDKVGTYIAQRQAKIDEIGTLGVGGVAGTGQLGMAGKQKANATEAMQAMLQDKLVKAELDKGKRDITGFYAGKLLKGFSLLFIRV